jgi:hypothetical protein
MIYKHVPIHRINRAELMTRFAASMAGAAAGTFLFLCVAALAA